MNEIENKNLQDFKVADSLGYVVNRVAILMRKNLTVIFNEQGIDLTPEEFAILSRLWEEDGIFQSEITERSLKDKTRVTRLLGRLSEKKFIEKKIDDMDRRNYRIFLTEKGSNHRYKVVPIIVALMAQAACQISSVDLEITSRTLQKVFNNLNHFSLDKAGDG